MESEIKEMTREIVTKKEEDIIDKRREGEGRRERGDDYDCDHLLGEIQRQSYLN